MICEIFTIKLHTDTICIGVCMWICVFRLQLLKCWRLGSNFYTLIQERIRGPAPNPQIYSIQPPVYNLEAKQLILGP